MENMVNFYDVLGIKSNANDEEIKHAYKQKAKVYHPDHNDGSKTANDMFQILLLAKETLLDKDRRQDHDIKLGVKENEAPKNTSITSQIVGWGLLAFVAGIAIAGGFKSNRNN